MALLTALDRRHTIAPSTYNRWLIPPAALAVHLCIGQVYATSVYKTSMVAHFGTSRRPRSVSSSRIAIVMLGLSAAVGGTWVERNGPRKAMFVAACFWGCRLPHRRARHRHPAALAALPRATASWAGSASASVTSRRCPR